MSKKKKMNGGLLLNETHESKTIEDAIDFFKSNSTFSILTNTSSACITFKAELKDDIDSPFIQIRSGIIEQPVKTLLFKYFPINPSRFADTDLVSFYTYEPRGGVKTFIELSQAAEIQKEYDIQLQLYETTYNTISSAYEPVCPYPISYFTDLDKEDTIQEIIDQLDETNKEKNSFIITDTLCGNLNDFIKDSEDESHFTIFNKKTKKETTLFGEDIVGVEARLKIHALGCIVMEFMAGYTTLQEYLKTASENDSKKAISLAAYEVARLKQIGFIHGDLVLDNIMYDPTYEYIRKEEDEEDEHKGRALLIDFGQSSMNLKALTEEEEAFYLTKTYNKHVDVYERNGRNLKFHPPYTFQEIYTRRLDVSLTFRETRIKELEKLLELYDTLSTKKEKKKFLQDKKIQLKVQLITNSNYPENFLEQSKKNFRVEAFNDLFDKIIIPILTSRSSRIQELQKLEMKVEGVLFDRDSLTKRVPELGKGIHSHKKHKTHKNHKKHKTHKKHKKHKPHKTHKTHKKQNALANRRIKTILKVKRKQ